jgi:lipoate-protein ligase A
VTVDHCRATTADLHALDPEALLSGRRSAVVLMEPTDRAMVLGSSQPDDLIDVWAAARAGFAVARRRSGGGVVVTGAVDAVWVDVLLAPDHPRWRADVDRAAVEVGHAWCEALVSLGGAGDVAGSGLVVHEGPPLHRDSGRIVCFGGLGPGEVTLQGAKLVGISQRRARWGARFQCQVQLRWAPEEWLEALRPPAGAPALLLPLTVATITAPRGQGDLGRRVAEALAAQLG